MLTPHKDNPTATPESLALLGMETVAYIRPICVNGRRVHVIHAADGTPLTVVPDRELALITIRQNEMQPLSVH
jgi:hypothetical protein